MRYRVKVVDTVTPFLESLLKSNRELLLERVGSYVASAAVRRIREGVSPPNAPLTTEIKGGDKTLQDTGRLMSSITYRVKGNRVFVGTDCKYAAIQQFGGVVKPKKAGKLCIPASSEAKKLLRKYSLSPGKVISGLKSKGFSVYRRGNLIEARQRGGKAIKLFILKDEVKIPARPFLYVDEKDEEVICRMVKRWIEGE